MGAEKSTKRPYRRLRKRKLNIKANELLYVVFNKHCISLFNRCIGGHDCNMKKEDKFLIDLEETIEVMLEILQELHNKIKVLYVIVFLLFLMLVFG